MGKSDWTYTDTDTGNIYRHDISNISFGYKGIRADRVYLSYSYTIGKSNGRVIRRGVI